jgi:AAA domain
MHLLSCVARGVPWGGREVIQAPVVYVAAEGAGGIKKRIAGLKKAQADEGVSADIYFYLITVAPNLGTGQEDFKELLACIQAVCARPGIIAIDTLAQSLGSADENGAGMVQFVANAAALANQLQCHVATIHHVPLADDQRLRGNTVLIGGLDASVLVERQKGEFTAVLTVKKLKDEDDGQKFTVHLSRIVICRDKKDREVSILVVDSIEPGAVEAGADKGRKLPDSAINAFAALRYALAEVGAVPPASNHIPSRTMCVSVEQWRTYMDLRSNLENPDSKLKAFVRGSERLQSEKIVGIWQSYVLEAKQAGQTGHGGTT